MFIHLCTGFCKLFPSTSYYWKVSLYVLLLEVIVDLSVVDILESFPLYGLLLEVIGSCVSPAYSVVDILESFPLYGLLLEVIGSCVSPAYRVMST